MSSKLSPEAARQLAARVNYYREMGIYDFYRQPVTGGPPVAMLDQSAQPESVHAEAAVISEPAAADQKAPIEPTMPIIKNKSAALKAIREDIGDCTRCRLHKGRTNIVFGVGKMNADIMFVGEGPGADEDAQGEPFVGRAGQLLNYMITAMGISREDVYIANVVKCRPPGNRTPEREECDTCSPFLMRQIDAIKPTVIVALGAVAAKNLLGLNDSMASLRGRVYDFRGAKLIVTYHPAFLLRDPRQKGEAWKDLQIAMRELGLKVPKQSPA